MKSRRVTHSRFGRGERPGAGPGRALLLLVFTLGFGACGGERAPALNDALRAQQAKLEWHRALWQAQQFNDYQFNHWVRCNSCSPEGRYELTFTVRDGELVEGFNTVTAEYLDAFDLARYFTFAGWFAYIEAQIAERPFLLEVEYDPQFGFPTEVRIDYIETVLDDELAFYFSNFQ